MPRVRSPLPRGPATYNIDTDRGTMPKTEEKMREDVRHRPAGRNMVDDREDDADYRGHKFNTFTSLNRSQEEIFHTIKNNHWFHPPKSYREGAPQSGPNDLLCEFHNAFGHTTEGCTHLRNKIEAMVRGGRLDRFVQRGREKERQSPTPPSPPRLPNREVRMIVGGETAGISNRARKAMIRTAKA